MKQAEIINYCNQLLDIAVHKDFCPNGLQVEGDQREVKRIAIGVSITLELIEKAIKDSADMIITHHGMIWDKDPRIISGPFRKKIKLLLDNGLAAAAYHLPLDYHLELGNNVQLARVLQLSDIKTIPENADFAEAIIGKTVESSIEDFSDFVSEQLIRPPIVLPFGKKRISKVVIITGGAQNYFMTAVENGADCFITGEASEKNYAMSQEYGVHFISAGHYATEKYGILALGEHLSEKFGIDSNFIEIDNPI
ncbi:Nif3-like dinuclear metal center hexameric protein [bacterium]|nr:Nif3-like dinuclear metal center hexameric protein [bacterium]